MASVPAAGGAGGYSGVGPTAPPITWSGPSYGAGRYLSGTSLLAPGGPPGTTPGTPLPGATQTFRAPANTTQGFPVGPIRQGQLDAAKAAAEAAKALAVVYGTPEQQAQHAMYAPGGMSPGMTG